MEPPPPPMYPNLPPGVDPIEWLERLDAMSEALAGATVFAIGVVIGAWLVWRTIRLVRRIPPKE